MTHYAITIGEYSAYHIVAITSDKEVAQKLCELFTKQDGCDEARIEAYEDGEVLMDNTCYFVRVIDGKVTEVCQDNECYREAGEVSEMWKINGYYTYVLTNSEEKAAKIGKDRIMKYIAEKEGL